MSTIAVTTVQSANGSTDLTLSTGNTSAERIVMLASGGTPFLIENRSTTQWSTSIISNQINSGYNYNGSTELAINYAGYLGGTTQFRDTKIFNGKNAPSALFQGSTKNFYSYGDVTAYYSSDARLKNNITNIDNALLKVTEIRGVTFDWNDDYMSKQPKDDYFNRKHDVGVIAQEIEKVLPEAVATRDDGIKAVRYEKLVPLLIEAIKELKQEIDELKKDR